MDNLNAICQRRCEIVNRPAYIVLFKGDDSDFTGNQTIYIDLNTELDLSGYKAHFRFMDYEQTYSDISSKRITLVFPSSQTSKFPLGAADASLVLIDSQNRRRTINNRIHIVVTNSVNEAYANEDPQAITVSVSGTYVQKQSDWNETNQEDPSFIKNKPTIPAPITIDPALSPTSENPVQNKAVAAALAAKLDGSAAYPAWELRDYEPPAIVSHKGRLWSCQNYTYSEPGEESQSDDWLEVTIEDLKQDALSSAQLAAANSGVTAAKVATWDGYAAQIAQKASLTDLPYAMVTPGEWEFSGSGYDSTKTYDVYELGGGEYYSYQLIEDGIIIETLNDYSTEQALSVEFPVVTATRASLPGHLCDRAGNRVVVSGDTTLTLPALVNAGKLRDFLVRLEISGSTVPTITFAAPTGETIIYETDGDEFPVPDEVGTWLYSFTETAAHTFAVSLKKVSVVTQGGV